LLPFARVGACALAEVKRATASSRQSAVKDNRNFPLIELFQCSQGPEVQHGCNARDHDGLKLLDGCRGVSAEVQIGD